MNIINFVLIFIGIYGRVYGFKALTSYTDVFILFLILLSGLGYVVYYELNNEHNIHNLLLNRIFEQNGITSAMTSEIN